MMSRQSKMPPETATRIAQAAGLWNRFERRLRWFPAMAEAAAAMEAEMEAMAGMIMAETEAYSTCDEFDATLATWLEDPEADPNTPERLTRRFPES